MLKAWSIRFGRDATRSRVFARKAYPLAKVHEDPIVEQDLATHPRVVEIPNQVQGDEQVK